MEERLWGEHFEMADNLFLFKFTTKLMTEQIHQGEWSWEKNERRTKQLEPTLDRVVDSITYEIEANTRASQKNERNSEILNARQTEEEQLYQDSKRVGGAQ